MDFSNVKGFNPNIRKSTRADTAIHLGELPLIPRCMANSDSNTPILLLNPLSSHLSAKGTQLSNPSDRNRDFPVAMRTDTDDELHIEKDYLSKTTCHPLLAVHAGLTSSVDDSSPLFGSQIQHHVQRSL